MGYLSAQEVADLTGMSRRWVYDHRDHFGAVIEGQRVPHDIDEKQPQPIEG